MSDNMKDLDFNKVKVGIRLPLVIGIGLILAEYILLTIVTLGLPFVANEFSLEINVHGIIGVLNLIIVLLFFAPLFVWTGYRVAERYKGDLLEAGVTASIVAMSLVALKFMLSTFLYLVAMVADITTLSLLLTKISLEGILTSIISSNGGVPSGPVVQLVLGTFCCFGRLVISGAVNFLVGGIGGYFGGGERE
jgi:hypothetical protein